MEQPETTSEKPTSQSKANAVFQHGWKTVKGAIKDLNFIQLHYIYFIGTSLITAIIFWGSSNPTRSVTFTDSLFLTSKASSHHSKMFKANRSIASAMTEAYVNSEEAASITDCFCSGLNTVNLSTLTTFQQFLLFLLIMMGSAIFVSAFVVHVRRNAFEDRFLTELDRERRARRKTNLKRSFTRVRGISRLATRERDAEAHKLNGTTKAPEPKEDGTGEEATSQAEPDQQANGDQKPGKTEGLALDIPPDQNGQRDSLDEENMSPISIQVSSPEETRGRATEASGFQPDRITFSSDTRFSRSPGACGKPDEHGHYVLSHLIPRAGIGARPLPRRRSLSMGSTQSIEPRLRERPDEGQTHHAFLKSGVLARNSTFHHMSEDDRERLGGLEYRAVRFLSFLVPIYFVLWQLLGALGLGAYVWVNRPSVARENGLNPFWVGAFNAVSAFNNSGMSLLDANMVAFQTSVYMLISMGLFILAGNTCYPVFLRLICWSMWKLCPNNDRFCEWKKTIRFLLDHPRRVYTNMFPSRETWWLLATVVTLNGIDCAFFAILNVSHLLPPTP